MRYCIHCGGRLPDDAAFCPHCGQDLAERRSKTTEHAGLIERAGNGDQQAVAALYERTYSKVYYTVRAMIKDEDAVFDILQDSYIKAFTRLDRFRGTEAQFTPWVKQIAANTARDWLKKKRPMLFSELRTGEDADLPAEELFEEERSAYIPEQALDRKETSRLIREILEELPEDQRAAIGMYYYEEMSVKEIAAAMGASENAVKSRLLYGRRKIEKKVRELEKKGTKLYGLAPVPFLLLLFRSQKTYAAEVPRAAILQNVLRSTAARSSGTAAHTAAAASAKAAGGAQAAGTVISGMSLAKAVVLAVAAGAAIGSGIFGVSKLIRSGAAPETATAPAVTAQAPAEQENAAPSAAPAPSPAAVQEDTQPAAEPSPTAGPAPVVTETPTPEPAAEDPLEEALAQYRIVLDSASSYDFGEYTDPSGTYRYALEYMHSSDPVPTLLLCENGKDFIDHVRIFYYDPAAGAMTEPDTVLMMGVAQTGGYRGALSMMGDGNGILTIDLAAMTGETYLSRAVRSGNDLLVNEEWHGRMDESDPYTATAREITWYDLSDLSGFENIGAPAAPAENDIDAAVEGQSASEENTGAESQDASAAWSAAELSAGRIVLTGTIDTYSHDETVALQGMPDPNTPTDDTYRIIVLDPPQVLVGRSVDGYQEGEVELIRVNEAGIPASYDGQQITFSVDTETLWWPSDTRMPLGQPGTDDIHVMDP